MVSRWGARMAVTWAEARVMEWACLLDDWTGYCYRQHTKRRCSDGDRERQTDSEKSESECSCSAVVTTIEVSMIELVVFYSNYLLFVLSAVNASYYCVQCSNVYSVLSVLLNASLEH